MSNLAVLQGYFDAMKAGGPPAAMPFYADDVVLEVPGSHPASGTYHGHAGVGEFGATMACLTNGTFRLTPDELLAGDEHVVTVATASANGSSWRRLILSTVRDNKLATVRFFEGDQELVDKVLTP
ncbi:nuclear transport factor 2 family protein [Paractinoplanes lichenicola]|uniref:Nuclear transport factor 2 family protein n=1 Tax=Paractinoplanes lichenicola TaxID=2802976 RepID=A0ABS1VF23_9ACTN|nr:nuclear transport factor 2 family protein [Actinoplanes lichenicola]MBL7253300.1 nuclear transport factor 2 family protein [Actinoplanes lichenicola]